MMKGKKTNDGHAGITPAVRDSKADIEALERMPVPPAEDKDECFVFLGCGTHLVSVGQEKKRVEVEFAAVNGYKFKTANRAVADALIARGFKQVS
jgi:hypothetical protein